MCRYSIQTALRPERYTSTNLESLPHYMYRFNLAAMSGIDEETFITNAGISASLDLLRHPCGGFPFGRCSARSFGLE